MRLTVYFPEDSPTTHEFVGPKITVGRLGDNDAQIDDGSVSSHHAEIELGEGSAVLRDLGSTNGTFVNGEQLTGEIPISAGDEIYFGSVRSVFMEPAAAAPVGEVVAGQAHEVASPVEAGETGRPANFTYMSPFAKPKPGKDMLAVGAWIAAGLGVAAAIYALIVLASA